MGSSRAVLMAAVAGAALAVPLSACTPPPVLTQDYFASFARRVSLEATAAALPREEFAPASFTFLPVLYHPYSCSDLQMLPAVRAQWWVSPNLALLGGLGGALAGTSIVQLVQVGLRYLPGSATLGPFTPEFLFVQQRMDGLPQYTLKWNHFQWGYGVQSGPWHGTAAVALMYQRSFPKASEALAEDVPGRLTADAASLILSAGYDVFAWARVTARLAWNPVVTSGGVQMSLAL